jgi:hypothetical protein
MQDLRLAADRGGAEHGAGRQAGIRVRRIDRLARRPEDQRVPRILPRQGAGKHDAGRQLRLQVLQAVDGEVDSAIDQRLVDLLGEEALAADLGQGPVLDPVARGGDDVLLEHRAGAPQHRAEAPDDLEEVPRLPEREGGAARAHLQRQVADVGVGLHLDVVHLDRTMRVCRGMRME